jgi:hypothetical protein
MLIVSLGVVGYWAYKNIFKSEAINNGELIVLNPIDSLIILNPINDPIQSSNASLLNKKKTALHNINEVDQTENIVSQRPSQISSGKQTKETALEIIKLKAEIETLSKNKNIDADLKISQQKIEELQQRVDKLVDKNSDVERENKRLFAVLRKLSEDREVTTQTKTWPVVFENKTTDIKNTDIPEQPNRAMKEDNKNNFPLPAGKKINPTIPVNMSNASTNSFGVESISLTALTVTDNKELESFQAFQTDKLVGTVSLKNINFQNNAGEIFIVVIQPDGHVLQKSTWESGTFQSREGKKIYTCRLRFDYMKGETKKLSFSINSSNYQKGNYLMQVYCGGVLIGKVIKSLS